MPKTNKTSVLKSDEQKPPCKADATAKKQNPTSNKRLTTQKPMPRNAEAVLSDIHDITSTALESGDIKTALKSLELEGKHLGMFKERLDLNNSGEIKIKWQP